MRVYKFYMNYIVDVKAYFLSHKLDDSLLLQLVYVENLNEVTLVIQPSEFFWNNVENNNSDGICRNFRRFTFQSVNEFNSCNMRFKNNGEVIYSATYDDKSTFTIDEFKFEHQDSKLTLPISSFGKISFKFECLWIEERITKVYMDGNKKWIYKDYKTNQVVDFYNPFN